ncbi:PREDICTED: sodium-independent sulfate anion transporter-like [Rhagoletis zephyria]|uniref:sodium-independent sulfate anion transporter-like n=1 Tax=Rhagoletis zephyria TaxID=28612 RepID=UPI0008112F19|nr:PREDICTED: sodium-independent sulfate anion transporter-like [Rhagoletis zephyria]
MSSVKTAEQIDQPTELQLNGSTDFILVTDHQKPTKGCNFGDFCESSLNNVFRKKTLYKRLPILQWLPRYTRSDAIGDLIAGITVGLTVIPQGLAYSSVAGLPTQYGLYGAFMGCFVYVVLGTCKDSTVGSTAIASLMVFQFAKGVWQRAVLLTFLTGIIEILMAFFRLGFIIEFVSDPVSAGFTSAVTLIISTAQFKDIIGIKNAKGTTFLERWISMINSIGSIRLADTILGCSCVAILLLMRFIGRIKVGPKMGRKWYHNFVTKVLWFISVSRNATLVMICAALSMYLQQQDKNYFRLTGFIPAGLPEFRLPPFSIEAVPANVTAGQSAVEAESFLDMVNNLGYGLLIVPLVALLENIAVCKALSKGQPIDASQELLAMGVANVANSFCQGYRANGGLARSAVNKASGVRTPLGNFYIGIVVMFALVYLTEFFYYIPKTVLASIIISAVIFQLQYQVIMPMWRSKRTDLIPYFVALVACLVMPLEVGILLGIGVNLLFILYHSARPKVRLETLETHDGIKFIKLTPDRCLIFPSVEFVRNIVLKFGNKTTLPAVIDCTYVYGADYTAAKVISSLIEDFKQRNQKIIFYNLKPHLVQIFEGLNVNLVLCYNTDALMQALKDNQNVMATNIVPSLQNDVESGVGSSVETLNSTVVFDAPSTDNLTKFCK